jgi:hypothetical protein
MDHRSSSKRVVYMLEKIDTATRQADTEPHNDQAIELVRANFHLNAAHAHDV